MLRRKATPSKLLEASRRLRREETPAEAILWECVRDRRLDGEKFKRQAVIGKFVVDFCSPRSRLVIELDGSVHNSPETQASDAERQVALEEEGYRIIRFRNSEVERNLAGVLDLIRSCLRPRS